jgi:hypothetical protein
MDRVAIRRLVHTQGDLKVPSHRCRYTDVQLQSSARIVFDSSCSRYHRSGGAMKRTSVCSTTGARRTPQRGGVLAHEFGGPGSALNNASAWSVWPLSGFRSAQLSAVGVS